MAPRRGSPDRAASISGYRRLASAYDAATRRIEAKRRRAIGLLAPRPGETVLDVACGTGAAFAQLSRAVGDSGRVIGVEHSAEMCSLARRRVAELGLGNVILVEAAAEEARIPGPVDAVLFAYAHDVLQSRAALDNVFAAARPGARVASAGAKLYPRWLAWLNPWLLWRTRHYLSAPGALECPWRLLAEHVPDFAVREATLVGSGYIGSGIYVAR
jgi:SAM-dependent methyltransferase